MIGTVLKELIEQRGVSINELARSIGVSAQTLYSIVKRNNMKVDIEILVKLCNALDVPLEVFYSGLGDAGKSWESLDLEERELVNIYRSLDGHGRELLMLIARKETERAKQTGIQQIPSGESEYIV